MPSNAPRLMDEHEVMLFQSGVGTAYRRLRVNVEPGISKTIPGEVPPDELANISVTDVLACTTAKIFILI